MRLPQNKFIQNANKNREDMKKTIYYITVWVLTLACMAMIFGFSAQTGEKSGKLSTAVTKIVLHIFYPQEVQEDSPVFATAERIVRKCGHAAEYGLLAVLYLLSFGVFQKPFWMICIAAFLCCFAFACTDEWHQIFVAARAGRFYDVLIDSGRAALAIAVFAGIRAFALRWRCNQSTTQKG